MLIENNFIVLKLKSREKCIIEQPGQRDQAKMGPKRQSITQRKRDQTII